MRVQSPPRPVHQTGDCELASATEVFDERVAAHYEPWYGTVEGRRADGEEKDLLGGLLTHFPGAGAVLEVGCGTGHFIRWLCDQGLAPVGLDRSKAMLAQANCDNECYYVRGDALRLPFVDGAFDLVAFVTTLEFLERPRVALVEAARVARKGLVLGVLSRWSPLGMWRRFKGLWCPTVYRAAHFFGRRELYRLVRSVVGPAAHVTWHATLYPRAWPRMLTDSRWGGFIGMAVDMSGGS